MIVFQNESTEKPFVKLKKFYEDAVLEDQKIVEAISVSSYCSKNKEVNSRYVNLKFVDRQKLIFFSNYNSPKARQFKNHRQASISIFWNTINVQVRMKGFIEQMSYDFNKKYFSKRSQAKNALAISSNQSMKIDSYDEVIKKYESTLKYEDLTLCPDYWGGFEFTPYYIEFWQGHQSRINRRVVFEKNSDSWDEYFLEP